MKRKLLLILFVVLGLANAMAQNRTVTGRVTGADDGLSLPGVSIKIKGTLVGTTTDSEGNYSISVANGAVLEFTYIGYKSREVAVNSSNINVVLETDATQLGEVVVVAYGTAKKEAITGSVATLGAKDIENRVATNITNILAGVAPGIMVNAGNGQPGSGSAVRIRGFGSLSASNAPLYVVDGAVYDGNISDINPSDIESVSLLKDASSSALYGARGANGVIILTTKKGKLGAPQLNVNLNQGVSERGIPEYDRLNASEYYPAMWQALRNSLVYPRTGTALTPAAAATQASNTIQSQLLYNPFDVPNNEIVGTDGNLNPNASLLYNDFDWYDQIGRKGQRTDANMSVGGNTGNSDFFISLGYLDDQGYVQRSDFKRYNGRVNVNSKVKPWLRTGLNVSGAMSGGDVASDAATGSANSFINVFNFARGIGPIYPVRAYDAAGKPVIDPSTGMQYYDYGQHPGSINRPQGASAGRNVVYETMLNDNLISRSSLNARAFTEIKFLKGFTFRPNISVDLRNNNETNFRNAIVGDGAGLGGSSYKRNIVNRSYTFNQVLTYDKSFGNHNVNVLAGHENYDFDWRSQSGTVVGQILAGNTEFPNFVTPQSAGGYRDVYRIESYLSRVSYNFNEKYYFEGSFRTDGSSRFSSDARWGTFYSLGASWALNKENFLSKMDWIDDLRIKASYGEVGNDDLLVADVSSYYNYQAFYDLGWNNGSEPGILLSTVATPDLKWESVNTFNTGVAFSLFKNRLSGELEFFRRGSSDLLFSVPQPLSDPVTTIRANIGSMYNTGLDLQLGGDIIRSKSVNWNILTNWSVFKNEITKMPASTPTVTSGTKRREVGKDLYNFYLRQWVGVDPTDGAALYVPADGVTTQLRTVNGQVVTTDFNNAKFDYSGTAIPDLFGSVINTFNYKNFGLSFLINYQIGGKFYDSNYLGLMSVAYGSALHKDVLNSWTTPGQVTDIPRLDIASTSFFNAASSRWLIDASYISFRNANLSYRIPASLLKRVDVASARIFVAGENLGLISRRKGMNPTETFDGTNDTRYLPSRIVSFGLNLSL